jgi:protein-S-isoprenylcysteine O-methyltransferase Ste14
VKLLEARIPPPVVDLAAAALMWAIARALPGLTVSFPGQLAFAIAVALIGVAVSIAGVVAFRRAGTTVNPLKPERSSALVAAGIYARTRNPMYAGMAAVLLGWGIWLGNLPALLALPLFVGYITRFQIRPEERILEAKFGEAFRAYCRQVRRWL